MRNQKINKLTIILFGFGVLYLIPVALFNRAIVHWVFYTIPKNSIIPPFFDRCQLYFGLAAAGLLVLGYGTQRWFPYQTFTRSNRILNGALLLLSTLFPLLLFELAAPSDTAMHKTTIYQKDDQLGWRLKPNAEGVWGAVHVRTNSKGLRGPDYPYTKPDNTLRCLFLGDSVTFGYGIADYQNTIPPLVESHLNTHSPNPIQCINAGIGGYSPWQEYLFLQKEGLKYQPDIVVLSFILNDVTEKTRLITFGGADEGFQLSRNVNSLLDRLNFYFFLKRYIIPTLIYGVQVQQGAVQKDLQYGESLVYEADSPKIQEMWDITFHNLYQIQTLCRKHNILFCIVMYPYAFQIFEASLMNDPQKQVKDFCKQHSIPFLDLLPPLSQRIIETDADLDGYFLDTNHPNAQCNRVIARWVADFLRNEVLVTE